MTIEKWIVDGPKVIDLDLVRSAKITLIAGKVDVLTHDEPTARVEVHSVRGRDLKIWIDGEALEIDHPQLRWDNFIEVFSSFTGKARADVSVLIPRTAALTFGVISSSALISGVEAPAKVNTVSGDIVIDGGVGPLDVNSVTGEVSISDHRGSVQARTVSGDITAAGAIGRFSADGVSADVVVDTSVVADELANNTVSGAFTLRLPEGSSAKYTFNSVSGTIHVDGTTVHGTMGRGFESRTGDLDGSFAEVRANSVSGDITVLTNPVVATGAADRDDRQEPRS